MNRLQSSGNTQAWAPAVRSPRLQALRFALGTASLTPWFLLPAGALITFAVAKSPNIFTFSIAAAACIWAAYRWPLAFVVLTLWTSVVPTVYVFEVSSFGFAPYILLEALTVIGLTLRCFSRESRVVVPRGFKYLVAYVALTSISALLSTDAISTASLLVRLWLTWLMVCLVPMVVPDRRRLRLLLAALFIHALLVVAVSVVSSLNNLDVPSFPSLLFLHFQKNDYGTYLSFAVALAIVAVTAPANNTWARILGVVLLILVGVGWPITYSRSGMMAMIAMLSVLLYLHRTARMFRTFALAAVLAAASWMVLPSEVTTLATRAVQSVFTLERRGDDAFDQNTDDRIALDFAAIESIRQRPLLGLGLGEWQSQSPLEVRTWDIKSAQVTEVGASIHNRYLLIAAESGVFALAAYLAFLAALLRSAIRIRPRTDREMRLLLNALVACTAGFLVSGLFLPGTLWEWNLLAVLAATVHVARREVLTAAAAFNVLQGHRGQR